MLYRTILGQFVVRTENTTMFLIVLKTVPSNQFRNNYFAVSTYRFVYRRVKNARERETASENISYGTETKKYVYLPETKTRRRERGARR